MGRSGFDTATNPLQQRYLAVSAQIRELVAEQRTLRLQLQIGRCEVCGNEFRRARVTRKHCSQVCSIRAYAKRVNGMVDIDTIREALPLLKAGRMLSPRVLALIEIAINQPGEQTSSDIAVAVGTSRQYVSSTLGRATKAARLALALKVAIEMAGNKEEAVHT